MKMKKYIADSMPEAMRKVRAEHGDDAVILNTKVITNKKFFGLLKQKQFEVVVGLDDVVVPKKNTRQTTITVDPSTEALKKEIASLKAVMQNVEKYTKKSAYPDVLEPYIAYLQRQELAEELITPICDELFVHMQKEGDVNFKQFEAITRRFLTEKLQQLPFGGIDDTKRHIHVLGPTGVGKTTTIAKIAARTVLEKKRKVGFITTDTYRIAAIEQLKTYAGLLQSPVEVAYSADDYQQALKKLDVMDVIFVDTAGRNYKEARYVEDLTKLITFSDDATAYLVLSTNAKENDMIAIIDQFKEIPIEKFIFTKVDETNSIGTMINLMIKYNKGIAYYTNGQEVPEHIEEATIEQILQLFFKGEAL